MTLDGVDFVETCERDKQRLYEEHKRQIFRSVRRWERDQIRTKTRHRATRLSEIQRTNQQRLLDLQQGSRAYNLKSIRQAAMDGDTDKLIELLDQGFDPNAPSAMGSTPLLVACQSGCLEAVRLLVSAGAHVNHQHVKSKRTALMEACSRSYAAVVLLLLRSGADLNARDSNGETAIDCATNPAVSRYLLLASSLWSDESAFVFPAPFRYAAATMSIIAKRQCLAQQDKRASVRREISLLVPSLVRCAAEARVRLDEAYRTSRTQLTLLKKIELQRIAELRFDSESERLFALVEEALMTKAEAHRLRSLSPPLISLIFSFCSRHWFDKEFAQAKPKTVATPRAHARVVRCSKKQHTMCAFPPEFECELMETQRALQETGDRLRQLEEIERSDPETGVTRSKLDGRSLARLQVTVVEARYLSLRDARRSEPQLKPLVRVSLRDRPNPAESALTGASLGDHNPTWDSSFSFEVESVKGDLLFQVIDAKNHESVGEIAVGLRSLLDQKRHDLWLTLPPTLKQQLVEKGPRLNPAQLHVILRLVHTESIVLSRELQTLNATLIALAKRKRELVQGALDSYIRRLTN